MANEKDKKPDKLKINLLVNFIGSQAIKEYSHFVCNGEESEEYHKMFFLNSKFKNLLKGIKMLFMNAWCLIDKMNKRRSALRILSMI